MPSTQRHTSLSRPSMISPPTVPRKPRKLASLSSTAHQAKTRATMESAKSELRSERKELKKFRLIAQRHTKSGDLEGKDTQELLREVIIRLDRNFFRAAYTSSSQQKHQVQTIMNGLQATEIFDDPQAVEQVETFVMEFMLKNFATVMVPAIFPGIKELRLEFAAAKDNEDFTLYSKLAIDKARFWKLVVKKRSKLSEKLNLKIFSMFEDCLGHNDYESAMASAGTSLVAKWSIQDDRPKKWECELLFGYEVADLLNLYRIVRDWAADCGQDVDASVKTHLPGLLSTRAVHKGLSSLNSRFEIIYRKLQRVLDSEEIEDSNLDFSRSEPQLNLPMTQDLFGDDELEELFAELENGKTKPPSNPSSKPGKKMSSIPNSQADNRVLSWMDETDDEAEVSQTQAPPETPKPKKKKKPRVTFTFGATKQTSTAKRKRLSRPQPKKRTRFAPPALPSLEPLKK